MSARPRVLVVYKKSAYRIYVHEHRHARLAALIRSGDRAFVGMLRAHRAHERTLQATREALTSLGVRATFRRRSAKGSTSEFDLVVTVGGDGTLLWASQAVGANCPLLAINSAPDASVGYFCAASREQVGDALAAALAGQLPETYLTRLRVDVDGEHVSSRVLNDVLFSHASPAATTRYSIKLRGVQEEHKSSGVWIATPAGSTAAIRSAGGRLQPIDSPLLQYVVREPYAPLGAAAYQLRKGLIAAGARLEIQSHIRTGRLYLDGPHIWRSVDIGARIRVSRSEESLCLLGFRGRRRRRS
jgi:NAD+ kinase